MFSGKIKVMACEYFDVENQTKYVLSSDRAEQVIRDIKRIGVEWDVREKT